MKSIPLVMHEVIDHGTEPIHTWEYTSVGKVTEFRAGDRLKSCIKDQNQNFGCLNNLGNVGHITDVYGEDI